MTANTMIYTPGALPQRLLAMTDRFAVLDTDIAQAVVREISSHLSPSTVLSFDVFDTLLLRNHRSELTRFYEVSQLIVAHLVDYGVRVSVNDVLMARLLANRLSYRLSSEVNGCREGTIADIYRTLIAQFAIPATNEIIESCIDIELTYEVTQLTVNQPLFALIHQHTANGGRVIYVSDMYLTAAQINNLLGKLGLDVGVFAATYSSADTILSKRSGKIWSLIMAQLAVAPQQIVHVGDSLLSDYQNPRAQGMAAVYVPIPLQMRRDIMADHGSMVQQLESQHLPIQSWMSPPHW